MELSVVIVSYNVKYFLEQCLHSVITALKGIDGEVIVVDNDSADGSVDYLQPLFPDVQFIRAGSNLGFGKANNLGWQQSSGNFVLFLNPDTIVPENTLTTCVRFFQSNSRTAAVGVRMIDGTGRFLPESKRAFPAAATAFYKAAGLAALFPKSSVFNRYALGYLPDNANHRVDVLAGAFMMVRRPLLEQTKGFDEAFFMYGEDIDLSYRLQQNGFENWYLAEPSIVHFKGESLKKWSADHVKIFYEAMITFVKKHFRGRGASAMRLMLIAGIRSKAVLSFLFGAVRSNRPAHRSGISLIVGSSASVETAAAMMKATIPESSIQSFSGTAEALKTFCISNPVQCIVFCSDGLPCTQAIAFMQEFGNRFTYRFHAAGSASIVGSDDKSNQGAVMHTN